MNVATKNESVGSQLSEHDRPPDERSRTVPSPEQEHDLVVQMQPLKSRPLTIQLVSRSEAIPSPILDAMEPERVT